MGHLGNARKCPPVPWRCELKEDYGDYLYIVDANGERIGALWGPCARIYPAARLLEFLTQAVDPERIEEVARPLRFVHDPVIANKAERDERARLRGIRMRKARLAASREAR